MPRNQQAQKNQSFSNQPQTQDYEGDLYMQFLLRCQDISGSSKLERRSRVSQNRITIVFGY